MLRCPVVFYPQARKSTALVMEGRISLEVLQGASALRTSAKGMQQDIPICSALFTGLRWDVVRAALNQETVAEDALALPRAVMKSLMGCTTPALVRKAFGTMQTCMVHVRFGSWPPAWSQNQVKVLVDAESSLYGV